MRLFSDRILDSLGIYMYVDALAEATCTASKAVLFVSTTVLVGLETMSRCGLGYMMGSTDLYPGSLSRASIQGFKHEQTPWANSEHSIKLFLRLYFNQVAQCTILLPYSYS